MSNTNMLDAAARNLDGVFKNPASTGVTQSDQLHAARNMLKGMAQPLVRALGITETATEPLVLLDMACGSGVVTQETQALLPRAVLEKSSIVAADTSAASIDLVNHRIATEGWLNVEAKVLDARDSGLPDKSFSHVAISLGLHLIPRPDDAVRESMRVLRPGGVFVATVPHQAEEDMFWQGDFRRAFDSFPFEAPFPKRLPSHLHEDKGEWGNRDWIEGHMRKLGLLDVNAEVVRGTLRIQGVEDFMTHLGPMIAWVTNTWWSEETRKAHPLEEVKELMRKHLQETYKDEGWDLVWELICVSARVAD
jgi:SAM-dependent methyltransferase